MRKFMTVTALFGIFTLTACGSSHSDVNKKTFFAMDTAVTVIGSSENAAAAEEIITELDMLFDRYDEYCDIYALNVRDNIEISGYTDEIIRRSMALTDEYGQAVSIFAGDITDCWSIGSGEARVPSDAEIEKSLESFEKSSFFTDNMSFSDEYGSIDLGCVAKGYALDKVRARLGENEYYIVSANSSVLLNGNKPDGEKFTVAVRDPESPDETLGTIKTNACFLSTSGGYERYFEADGKKYSHIFDLTTGRPSETDLTSVTVLCDSGIKSDFLSTLVYSGGTENLHKYLNNDDFLVAAVTADKEIYLSDGIDFTLNEDSPYTIKELANE